MYAFIFISVFVSQTSIARNGLSFRTNHKLQRPKKNDWQRLTFEARFRVFWFDIWKSKYKFENINYSRNSLDAKIFKIFENSGPIVSRYLRAVVLITHEPFRVWNGLLQSVCHFFDVMGWSIKLVTLSFIHCIFCRILMYFPCWRLSWIWCYHWIGFCHVVMVVKTLCY